MSSRYSARVGGVSTAAQIMNRLRSDVGDQVLENLTELDEGLSQKIQDHMMTFDQLSRSDDRSLQTLIQEIDNNVLMIALKGAAKPVRDQFFKNMSTRSRDIFVDEMNALGPTRRSDIEDARKSAVRFARRLSDDGKFVLPNGGYI